MKTDDVLRMRKKVDRGQNSFEFIRRLYTQKKFFVLCYQ